MCVLCQGARLCLVAKFSPFMHADPRQPCMQRKGVSVKLNLSVCVRSALMLRDRPVKALNISARIRAVRHTHCNTTSHVHVRLSQGTYRLTCSGAAKATEPIIISIVQGAIQQS